eukprot:m.458832 g.458832  ORF g.458832 m.458832 type:complete len:355 (+) comp56998_c2_seq6:1741-2805(+)
MDEMGLEDLQEALYCVGISADSRAFLRVMHLPAQVPPESTASETAVADQPATLATSTASGLDELHTLHVPVRDVSLTQQALRVIVSPLRGVVIASMQSEQLHIYDSTRLTLLHVCDHRHGGSNIALCLSHDETMLLTGDEDGLLTYSETEHWEVVKQIQAHEGWRISAVRESVDGTHFVTASWDSSCRVWNPEGRMTLEVKFHFGQVYDALVLPQLESTVVTCGYDKMLIVWNHENGARLRGLTLHDHWVSSMTASDVVPRFVTADVRGHVIVWDSMTFEVVWCRDYSDGIRRAEISPNALHVLVLWGSETRGFRGELLDVTSGHQLGALLLKERMLKHAVFGMCSVSHIKAAE